MENNLKGRAAPKYRVTISIIPGIAAAVVLVLMLNSYLDKSINNLKNNIISEIENKLGKTVVYESISPSVFKHIEIRKLYINDTSGRIFLKVDRLIINLKLINIFFPSKNPVKNIYLENSSLNLDSISDKKTIIFFYGLIKREISNGTETSISNISFSAKNLAIETNTESGNYSFDRLFLDVDVVEEKIDISLKSDFHGDNLPFYITGKEISSTFKIEGTIDTNLNKHDYNIEINNFKNKYIELRKQYANIQYSDGNLIVRKTKDRAPVDIVFSYSTTEKKYNLSAIFENFRPSRFFYFNVENQYIDLLRSDYSGRINVTYDAKNPFNRLKYNGTVNTSIAKSIVPFRNNVYTKFSGDTSLISFDFMNIETENGDASFRGVLNLNSLLPAGSLSFNRIKYGNGKFLNGSAVITATGANSAAGILSVESKKQSVKNARFNISRQRNRYVLGINADMQKDGLLQATAVYTYENPRINLSINAENLGLDMVIDFLYPDLLTDSVNPAANIGINSSMYFYTDFTDYTLYSENIAFFDRKNPENSLQAKLQLNSESLSVHDIRLSYSGYSGSGNLLIGTEAGSKYRISSELIINNQFYLFDGNYYPESGFILTGNYGIYCSVFTEKGKTIFSFFSEKMPFPFKNTITEVSVRSSGFFDSKGNSKIFMRNNKIEGVPLKNSAADLLVTAQLTGRNFRISKIAFTDNFSELTGKGEFYIKSRNSLFGWVSLQSDDKKEQYLSHIDFDTKYLNIFSEFKHSPASRIFGETLEGGISGNLTFTEIEESPELSLNIDFADGLFTDTPLSGSLSVYADLYMIDLINFDFSYNHNRIRNGSGYIDYESGRYYLNSEVSLRQTPSAYPFLSTVTLTGKLSEKKHVKDSLFDVRSDDFVDGQIFFRNGGKNIFGYENWSLSFTNSEKQFSLEGGPQDSISAFLNESGNFSLELKKPLPLNGKLSGRIKDDTINATFENIVIGFDFIGKTLRNKFFAPLSGTAEGTLYITGKINDPDIYGELLAKSIVTESSVTPERIGPFNSAITFEGKEFHVRETMITMNRALLYLNADFIIDRWLPNEFYLNIRTTPESRVPIRSTFAKVDVDGFASGEIAIAGDTQQASVTGKIAVNRCIITLTDDKEITEDDSDFGTIADLEFVSGSGVEFYWPSVRLPVLRAFASTGQQLKIYSNSLNDLFSMNGNINILGGEIFYFNQNFFIKEGSILFNENQDKFDPHITARAEIRERTADNREVKISLILDDNPLSQFAPRFESSPPLQEGEIFALLGEGIYSQFGGENITFGSALAGAGAYSTQLIGFLRPFETTVKRMLNLDHFSIRTQFLQRAFFSDIMQVPDETFPNDAGFNTYFDNTSIFMGKYYGEYFFLEGLLRINTMDFDTSQYYYYDVPDFMGMYIETEISLEVDTPLFLLDITLYPRFTEFYESLLDTTLQLSWRFSF